MRKFGFYFSELIIATLLYVGVMWYFAWQGYVFSPYNREISGVIFVLFGVGIAIVTYHLLKLSWEDRQLALFAGQAENFRIAVNQLRDKRYALSPEMTANKLRKTVDDYFAILEQSLLKEWAYKILNMTLHATKPDQNALSLLLQQRVEVGGNRIRYIAGVLVMIGLLGTFLGLIQSLKYLQHFFTASEGLDINTLFSDMKQTLGGLDKAFGTSIGGILAYLVLGYLNIVLRTKQAYILSQIEEVLLDHILPVMEGFLVKTPSDSGSAAIEILQTLPQTVAEELRRALETIMQQTIGGSTARLEATGAHLQSAAEGIQQGQETLTETLRTFGDFLTTVQESRAQLALTQQTLASGVKAFAAEIANLKEQMQANGISPRPLSGEFGEVAQAIAASTAQMQGISTGQREVFGQLAETMRSDHAVFVQTAQRLETFLQDAHAESQAYFQDAQAGVATVINENTAVNQELLQAHTMLATLLHDLKTFIRDEQQGLSMLSASLQETFGEARFQYAQLTGHFEEFQKRLVDSQDQLAQVQETTAAIQQHVQRRQ